MTTLFQFSGEQPAQPWRSNNDGVMGGLSEGAATIGEGGMLFRGTLSLENNGGFSSVYASGEQDLSAFDGVRLRVKGDGRTYQFRFNSDALYRSWSPVAFSKEFETVAGEWIDVVVPFNELNQTWRGRQLEGYTFNTSKIDRLAVMLADKQPGDFEIVVSQIEAVKIP